MSVELLYGSPFSTSSPGVELSWRVVFYLSLSLSLNLSTTVTFVEHVSFVYQMFDSVSFRGDVWGIDYEQLLP